MDISKEVDYSIKKFVKHFNLDIPAKDVEKFLIKDREKKSIGIIGDDPMDIVKTFLNMTDALVLTRTCKDFYTKMDKLHEDMVYDYYPKNKIISPKAQWKNLCIDWYICHLQEPCYGESIEQLKDAEQPVIYCLSELKKRNPPSPNALSGSLIAIDTYQRQLMYESEVLFNHMYELSPMIKHFLKCVAWLIPSGYISDMPEIDSNLYGGSI